ELVAGDTFLLCSDGLSDYFESQEFCDIVRGKEVSTLPAALVQFANEKGGKDNVTAVVVRVEGAEKAEHGVAVSQKVTTLKKIPLFRHLTYKELVAILDIARMSAHAAGESIIAEGKSGEEMFLILTGSVKVHKRGKHLATLDKGDFFGEM